MIQSPIRRVSLFAGMLLAATLPTARDAGAQSRSPHTLTTQVSDSTRRELIAAREAIWRAWFANDTVQLERLLPSAATAAEPEGVWQNRQAILDGSRQFAAGGAKLVSLDFSDTQILADGDIAVVHSTYRVKTVSNGQTSTSGGRATEVFVRQGGRWVNPFWHLQP